MLDRKKIAMIVAEFLGTGILTLVMLTVSKSNVGLPYFVSLATGLTVGGLVLAFGSISGAHFNPAITLGLWSVRRMQAAKAIVYIAAQLLGGLCAYLLYQYFMNEPHPHNSGHYVARILVGEAVGAFVFSLAWAAAVYRKFEDGTKAAVIGLGLIVGILASSSASGGILNPAVALGLSSWGWGTYVLGPVLGALLGFNLYALLFAPENGLLGTGKKPAASTSKKK